MKRAYSRPCKDEEGVCGLRPDGTISFPSSARYRKAPYACVDDISSTICKLQPSAGEALCTQPGGILALETARKIISPDCVQYWKTPYNNMQPNVWVIGTHQKSCHSKSYNITRKPPLCCDNLEYRFPRFCEVLAGTSVYHDAN